jgi:hypothetical protein
LRFGHAHLQAFTCLALGYLGSKLPDPDYVFWARIFTAYYFALDLSPGRLECLWAERGILKSGASKT